MAPVSLKYSVTVILYYPGLKVGDTVLESGFLTSMKMIGSQK